MRLDGKTILITGAARGIGRACATVMADLGADVGLFDINERVSETAEAVRARGRKAAFAITDISDPDQVHRGVAKVAGELGPIHGLVNNAGIVNNIAPLARMEQSAWQREIGVNLTGPFNMIRAVIGAMAERNWGRIVNVSSSAARNGLFNQVGYAATKAAVLGLTYNVALEYASQGITCNAVLPGLIATENVKRMPEMILEHAIGLIPARRLGEPEEVAYLIAFLCSDMAGFINGADIPIDGGGLLNPVVLGSRKAVMERSTPGQGNS
jgi:NAD(P)-dependent dehydrogenase (short-subunit alcohol dehydrogenase family)